jgi:hypothetical protein
MIRLFKYSYTYAIRYDWIRGTSWKYWILLSFLTHIREEILLARYNEGLGYDSIHIFHGKRTSSATGT